MVRLAGLFLMCMRIEMTYKNSLAKAAAALLITGVALHSTLVQAADPRNGARLYNNHCSGCHGAQGNGMMPGMPNFQRGERLFKPDAALVQSLERGSGVMPSFRGLMTTQEMLDVIAYLRTMN